MRKNCTPGSVRGAARKGGPYRGDRKQMSDAPRPGPDFDAVLRLQAELKNESPRGVALISAAMLEEALRELLMAFLVPNPSSSDTLFDGPTSPLGSDRKSVV